MRRRVRILALIMAAVFFQSPLFAADVQPAVISGKVVLIKTGTNQVLVAYKRPAAFVETISTFKLDEKTQLKNFGTLSELKLNDSVNVSYLESETGNFMAQQIEKVKPEGGSL